MTDNEVQKILFDVIDAGLAARAITGVIVQQSYQPTQQGANINNTVLLHPIDSQRYGSPEIKIVGSTRTESYWLIRTFQVDALALQDVEDTSKPTAFDLVDTVAAILQGPDVRQALIAEGIGIIRIQPLRMSYIIDDRGRNENAPSFDFTINYRQTRTSTVPTTTVINPGLYPV